MHDHQDASNLPAQKTTLPAPHAAIIGNLLPQLQMLLPPDITTEQFRAALYLEFSGRPALGKCSTESWRTCAIKAATDGMLPGRDCHFLPFRDKRKGNQEQATYVPNYFGIIRALERTGKIRRAFAHPVHDGDEWGFDMFEDRPVHKPAVTLGKKTGKTLFYYGAVMFKDGSCACEILTLEDVEAIKRRSPAHESGPWISDYDMMCRKSALKRVAKYVKLTPELQQMLEDDDQRQLLDIPEERNRQNIIDLFGDRDAAQEAYARAIGRPTPPEGDPGWRDFLQAHVRGLTGDLQEQCWAALRDPAYNDEAGNALAMAVADVVAQGSEN